MATENNYDKELAFTKKLRDDETLKNEVAALPANDWDGLKKCAENAGFGDVSLRGLKVVLSSKFYEKLEWDMPDEKKSQLKKKKKKK